MRKGLKKDYISAKFDNIANALEDISNNICLLKLNHDIDSDDVDVPDVLLNQTERLAKLLFDCRDCYLLFNSRTETDRIMYFNSRIQNTVNVKVEQLQADYTGYQITLPAILPHKKSMTDTRQIILQSLLQEFNNCDFAIEKIDKPAIIIEHRFDKYSKHKRIKDLDNYETSYILNVLQTKFIKDDRQAMLINVNNPNSFKNETVIYIINQTNFLDFAKKIIK